MFAGLTLSHTGDVFRAISVRNPLPSPPNPLNVTQRFNYGNHFVLDLNGGLQLGEGGHHQVNLRLENALDEDHASRMRGGTTDGGDRYAYSFLGTPRTLHLSYAFQF
jgi:hypothetical protein